MQTFISPDTFIIICVVLVLLFFLIRAVFSRLADSGKAKEKAYEDYLFASRELGIRDIRESMAATYCAFATVFFWFIALGNTYSWLLFLIPLFLYLGNVLFVRIVQKFSVKLGQYSTIGAYIRSKTSYKPLHYVSDWIIVIFLFSTVLVEMVIGSGILASIMPDAPGGQLFFIILLSVLVISYVVIGGFRAVILSDTVQLYLTITGVIALLIFSVYYLPKPQDAGTYLYTPTVNVFSLLAFVISVVVVQIFGPLCQLQNWQRITSSPDQEVALRGHRQGAILGASLWALMIICALILYIKLEGTVSFAAIFSTMKTSGVFSAYALYPLLFVGFVATMISTADSAMAALYLFRYDGLRRKKLSTGEEFTPTAKHHISTGVFLFVVILIVYSITQTKIQSFTITVIYFLFNQLLVLFPVLLFLVVEEKLRQKKGLDKIIESVHNKFERNQTLALALGWLTVLIMTGIGYFNNNNLNWIMFASGGGVLMVTIVMAPSISRLYRLRTRTK